MPALLKYLEFLLGNLQEPGNFFWVVKAHKNSLVWVSTAHKDKHFIITITVDFYIWCFYLHWHSSNGVKS